MPPDKPAKPGPSPWLLRRLDQAAVAGLILFALVAAALYWVQRGGLHGRMIEIDRAEPLSFEFQVDINTAHWTELVVLPELGETLARRIVEYREQNGPFQSADDLIRVNGIGVKTLEKLRPYFKPIEPARAVAGQ